MIPCINQATVMPTDTLDFINQSKQAGFISLEFDITRLEEGIKKHGLDTIKQATQNLEVVSLNAIENYPILTPAAFQGSLERCEEIFSLSSELDCDVVVVNPNEYKSGLQLKTEEAFDSFIIEAAKIASKFSVRLGYEYVAYEDRVVNTLAGSLASLSKWGSEIGLVLDAFHLYRTRENVTAIPERLMNRLWVFHINDAPSKPLQSLKDSDRVFPGEGVVDLRRMLDELASRGFNGPVSLELFNGEYWKRPAGEVLRESWNRVNGLL